MGYDWEGPLSFGRETQKRQEVMIIYKTGSKKWTELIHYRSSDFGISVFYFNAIDFFLTTDLTSSSYSFYEKCKIGEDIKRRIDQDYSEDVTGIYIGWNIDSLPTILKLFNFLFFSERYEDTVKLPVIFLDCKKCNRQTCMLDHRSRRDSESDEHIHETGHISMGCPSDSTISRYSMPDTSEDDDIWYMDFNRAQIINTRG